MSDQIGILSNLLRQTAERQGVLASNIANVDTPGYKAKDLKFEESLNAEMALTRTDPKHVAPQNVSASGARREIIEKEPWLDRNTVELDQEVAKMTENAMLYQAGVSLLSRKIQMFKRALKTQG